MSFCNQFLGKKISKVIYDDVVNYFADERIESLHIEFKSFANNFDNKTQIDAIYKSICAMLNSEGGLLIWGAPREKYITSDNFKVCCGPLTSTSTKFSRDQLINKFNSVISPMPTGITATVLYSQSDYIYLFEIAKSDYRPHQCLNTYWVRLDGQTKAAPHYLVEALFKQIKYPRLEGYIKFEDMYIYRGAVYMEIVIVIFNFSYEHNEYDVRYTVDIDDGVFSDYTHDNISGYESGGSRLVGNVNVLHAGIPITIHKTVRINLDDIECRVNIEEFSQEEPFRFELIFGGKVSPLKISYYEINFEDELFGGKVANFNKRLNWGYANRVVFSRVENQNVGDLQNKEDLLEYFLKEKL
jgi:hypothetical protein